ncbi:probable bifunctional dTTP/UTP pyrophosphatase/methyltransferase protein [Aplysia californica]|uniref:Probable bifunctional dTTP/UTP pyrophosphatase/methyltransferase protein n=1 Tax=Aplysia californica TaxID=6500 RepID=A0ABM0JGW4_APLCA|nr:probable bifunctional dTTP/UTP pyrophosphatase/methyltransferase protein [Aplysia californica]
MLQPFIHVLNAQRNILASSSPRRKLILENVGLKFEVISSTFEENLDKTKYQPQDYVLETARCKTEEVAKRLASTQPLPDLIIGADTVVSQGSEIFEKPKDKQDAVRILSQLSGNVHTVFTGVILFVPAKSEVLKSGEPALNGQFRYTSFVDSTEVFMSQFDKNVIEAYIETGEPLDKAGAYGIQAIGGTLVEKINGDNFNVMGFPLPRFSRELSTIYKEVIER